MKQEELLKTLIKELFNLNTMHQEYQDNDTHYIVDSQKEGDTLTIKVTLKENTDKKEFEAFINTLDDDLFTEVWEALQKEDNLHSLNELYNSKDYKKVITKFRAKLKETLTQKILNYQKLLSC